MIKFPENGAGFRYFYSLMNMSSNIDHYISELLFRHDCVVVPGLGGFVGNYAPARVHPTQHTFLPPSKQLAFNRNLQHNDGLLAQEIATSQHCSFDEAMQHISRFAAECLQRLRDGKKAELKNIGVLYYDIENNLQFEPDTTVNYLVESFGLSAFQSMPVKRDHITERREPKVEEVKRLEQKDLRRRRTRRLVAATLAVPFLLLAVWVPIRTDGFKNVSMATLNPFATPEKALYKAADFNIPKTDRSAMAVAPDTFVADSNGLAQITLTENSVPVVVRVMQPESTNVAHKNKHVATRPEAGIYYVIGGCFSVPANADNFLRKLEEKGYAAELLVNPKKSNLLHVSYGSSADQAEAEALLSRVKAQDPAAWMLIK